MTAKLAALVLGSLSVLAASAGGAAAQQCSDTSPCPRGFKCEVTAMATCTAPAPSRVPCFDGGMCPEQTPAIPAPDCRPQEFRSCVPGPCAADGDCAAGMVCHEQRTGTCATAPVAPCPPGAACPAQMLPATCTETVERQCVPRYLLPCAQASDCGSGFSCEPQQQCGCSGSGAVPPVPAIPAPEPAAKDAGSDEAADRAFRPAPADAGAPSELPSPPPECTCTPTEEKYCKPAEIDCASDGQCPALWSCKVVASSSGPSCLLPPDGAGDAGTCGVPAPVEIHRCVPPYEGLNVGVSRGGDVAVPSTGTPGHAPRPTPNAPMSPSTQLDAGTEEGTGAPDGAAPVHAEACSVMHAGAGSRGGLMVWIGLASLAAWFVRRRR